MSWLKTSLGKELLVFWAKLFFGILIAIIAIQQNNLTKTRHAASWQYLRLTSELEPTFSKTKENDA